jgi:hypothetical protein
MWRTSPALDGAVRLATVAMLITLAQLATDADEDDRRFARRVVHRWSVPRQGGFLVRGIELYRRDWLRDESPLPPSLPAAPYFLWLFVLVAVLWIRRCGRSGSHNVGSRVSC